ncbi:uncharacterized protein EDB91DRAFT_1290974 [Suillus paluster]|uniref:uncharacterized protein n=1 Tax=Suillus paluster TaxID=48578 RepID=UPI001B85E524|nr:uncharacterized protein EDB91DRAFT_1290974 [Suillus paluster]KAG1737079.1 hypothetical protein EDB91DRAFT_1290974 [Suillus paluster]
MRFSFLVIVVALTVSMSVAVQKVHVLRETRIATQIEIAVRALFVSFCRILHTAIINESAEKLARCDMTSKGHGVSLVSNASTGCSVATEEFRACPEPKSASCGQFKDSEHTLACISRRYGFCPLGTTMKHATLHHANIEFEDDFKKHLPRLQIDHPLSESDGPGTSSRNN